MVFEIPTLTLYVPEFLFTYWVAWIVLMMVGYLIWNIGREIPTSQGSTWPLVILKYSALIIGWWMSLVFFVLVFVTAISYAFSLTP